MNYPKRITVRMTRDMYNSISLFGDRAEHIRERLKMYEWVNMQKTVAELERDQYKRLHEDACTLLELKNKSIASKILDLFNW